MVSKRKALLSIALVLVLAIGIIFPIGLRQVRAIDSSVDVSFGNGNVQGDPGRQTVTYNVDGIDVAITVTAAINVNNKTASITINNGNELEGITVGATFNPDTMEIKLSSEGGSEFRLSWDNNVLKNQSGGIPTNEGPLSFTIVKKEGAGDDSSQGNHEYKRGGDTVYFVWLDGSNVYSHAINDVIGVDNRLNYVPLSTVKDDDTDTAYDMSNGVYEFCWKAITNGANQTSLQDYMNSDEFKNASDKREALKEAGFSINPAINQYDAKRNSTIVTNGDREFRVVIYNADTFEGIQFSQNSDAYTYFPSFWDSTFYTGMLDISGTTRENPAEYNTFVLEPTIKFAMADNSNSPITSLEALDVPSGAVTITGSGTTGYNIRFASHFFDNVVFRATSANGTYYIKINRAALSIKDNFGPETTNPQVIADLYYDESESYTDYDVYATIIGVDGTATLQKAEVIIGEDEGGNRATGYEAAGGKGLKKASFAVSASRDTVASVRFNVTKAGALNSGTYGGTYAGSNDGTEYNIASRRTIY